MNGRDSSPSATETLVQVERALAMTEERLAQVSADAGMRAMFGSIRNQLAFMRDTLAAGHTATTSEKNRLTLGVIAVREFEVTDTEYCDAISNALYSFKNL